MITLSDNLHCLHKILCPDWEEHELYQHKHISDFNTNYNRQLTLKCKGVARMHTTIELVGTRHGKDIGALFALPFWGEVVASW